METVTVAADRDPGLANPGLASPELLVVFAIIVAAAALMLGFRHFRNRDRA